MVICKVIRTCFFANRLYEVGEEVTFEDSVDIPEHFKVLGGVGKSETDFFEEEKATPAEVSEAETTEGTKKAATKSKATTKAKTKK
jgi:hypothetical protein